LLCIKGTAEYTNNNNNNNDFSGRNNGESDKILPRIESMPQFAMSPPKTCRAETIISIDANDNAEAVSLASIERKGAVKVELNSRMEELLQEIRKNQARNADRKVEEVIKVEKSPESIPMPPNADQIPAMWRPQAQTFSGDEFPVGSERVNIPVDADCSKRYRMIMSPSNNRTTKIELDRQDKLGTVAAGGPQVGSSGATALGSLPKPQRSTPAREAVDPAKYFTLTDEPDGTKYACSKCGNVYKWRKSLNKHWKEKHDGEIPEPRVEGAPVKAGVIGGSTQRRLPVSNFSRTASAIGTSHVRSSSLNKSGTFLVPNDAFGGSSASKYAPPGGGQAMYWAGDPYGQKGNSSGVPHFGRFSLNKEVHAGKISVRDNMAPPPGVVNPFRPAANPMLEFSQLRASRVSWLNDRSIGGESSIKSALARHSRPSDEFQHPLQIRVESDCSLPVDMTRGPQGQHSGSFRLDEDANVLDLSKKGATSSLPSPMGGRNLGMEAMFSSPINATFQDEPIDFSTKPSLHHSVVETNGRDSRGFLLGNLPFTSASSLRCALCPSFMAHNELELDAHREKVHRFNSVAQSDHHARLLTPDLPLKSLSSYDDRGSRGGSIGGETTPRGISSEQYHRCGVCTTSFATMSELNRHFNRRHADALLNTLDQSSGSSKGGGAASGTARELHSSSDTQLYR